MKGIKLILIIITLILCSCSESDNDTANTEQKIIDIFSENNLTAKISDFQFSRSESFPFGREIKLLYVKDEEIFIFKYENINEVEDVVTQDFLYEEGVIFYKENIILLYRGNDMKLKEILYNNFNVKEEGENE